MARIFTTAICLSRCLQFQCRRKIMTLTVTPPEGLKGPLEIPEKTLLGPGPSNTPDRVLKAMAMPTLGHLHPEFCKVMDDCKAGIQYAFQTKNKMTLALSSTGHAGMECVMTNLIERGDVVLIANHGIWGERAMDMAKRQGTHFMFKGRNQNSSQSARAQLFYE